jgi:Skp family chaperone for outer membrane proteins
VVRPRPRRAQQAPWQKRVARVAVPAVLAGLATSGIVAVATGSTVAPVASAAPSAGTVSAAPIAPASPQSLVREQRTSRGASEARTALADAADQKAKLRTEAEAKAAAQSKAAKAAKAAAASKAAAKTPSLRVVGSLYSRVNLNVRERNDGGSRLVAVLRSGSKVSVTRTVRGEWRYVAYRGAGGWVKNRYLVTSKPKASSTTSSAPASGISSAACPAGSAVESGLTSDAVRVHRAICARFPAVKAYGGVRADSLPEHPSGRALDAMISNTGTGWAIANFVRANAKRLGVSQVIFDRRIWTVQRGGEGWRNFGDRGSVSANHEDHVHVTVYGSSGG